MTGSKEKKKSKGPGKLTWLGVLGEWFVPKHSIDRAKLWGEFLELSLAWRKIRDKDRDSLTLLIATRRYTELSTEILHDIKSLDDWKVKLELRLLENKINKILDR